MCFSGKPCPPFKIAILDEADSMTGAAQVGHKNLTFQLQEIKYFHDICSFGVCLKKKSNILKYMHSGLIVFKFYMPKNKLILFITVSIKKNNGKGN